MGTLVLNITNTCFTEGLIRPTALFAAPFSRAAASVRLTEHRPGSSVSVLRTGPGRNA